MVVVDLASEATKADFTRVVIGEVGSGIGGIVKTASFRVGGLEHPTIGTTSRVTANRIC